MRYGVSMDVRQRRYALESHHDRPGFIGYRKSDWAPDMPYVDGDHFFGSGGFQRDDGAWMPSRAEALSYLYHLRGIERAFRDTAEGVSSPYLLTVRKALLELEYMLLGSEYRMSFHHHGAGRSIDDSARSAERRRLEAEIPELEGRIRQERRRLDVRRALRGIVTAPLRATRRVHRRAPIEPAGDLSAQAVEETVSGEWRWRALDPPWNRRDRTRWYEAGAGPLSPDSSGEGDMLPVPGARFVPAGPEESLLRVRPPRAGEFGLSGFRSVLDSLGERSCGEPGDSGRRRGDRAAGAHGASGQGGQLARASLSGSAVRARGAGGRSPAAARGRGGLATDTAAAGAGVYAV